MARQACENAVDPKHYTSGTWLQEVGNRGRIKLGGEEVENNNSSHKNNNN